MDSPRWQFYRADYLHLVMLIVLEIVRVWGRGPSPARLYP
ncbi:MAG: hypothetical protein KatS3mg112_0957 [Thermogutta sp.]|nr:MAG: hypothetical protein KatS3mg112_0957 [Thermogutta sp.]